MLSFYNFVLMIGVFCGLLIGGVFVLFVGLWVVFLCWLFVVVLGVFVLWFVYGCCDVM